jgi:16S rRNA (cytidine1402-2'-O)-methyltransferase
MGALVLVPTPIGNLKDITLRAIETLQEADCILAEDTRTSGRLLKHLEIKTRLKPFHKFNEHKVLERTLEEINAQKLTALISDAGTPGISDPGFLLVRACIEASIEVYSLPGATAFVPALVNSGLPCDRFVFEGFLPVKKGRQTRLSELAEEKRTIVLYESPHRLVKSLNQLAEVLGEERRACVSREISKLHEENRRGTLIDLARHYEQHPPKGEICLVLEGKPK